MPTNWINRRLLKDATCIYNNEGDKIHDLIDCEQGSGVAIDELLYPELYAKGVTEVPAMERPTGSNFGYKVIADPTTNYYDEVIQLAHRGFANLAPENTIAAFTNALNYTKHLGLDLRITSDDVVVVMHDTTVDDTSDGTGAIRSMTLAEVKLLDFGSYFSDEYIGERIATLEEFLDFARSNECVIYPELKSPLSNSEISGIITLIEDYDMVDNCVVTSFSEDYLDYVATINSDLKLGWISSTELKDISTIPEGSYIIPHHDLILEDTTNYVKSTQIRGMKVIPYTTEDIFNFNSLKEIGVYGVSVNSYF